MARFEMLNKHLEIMKTFHIHPIIPVTQSTEDLEVFLSRMTQEMILDLLVPSDPLEVADRAFHPGEGLYVGERAREDDVADLVSLDTEMFQPEMPDDLV